MVLWLSLGLVVLAVLVVGLAVLLFGEWLSRKVIRPWRPGRSPGEERGPRGGDPFDERGRD